MAGGLKEPKLPPQHKKTTSLVPKSAIVKNTVESWGTGKQDQQSKIAGAENRRGFKVGAASTKQSSTR